MPNEMDIPLDKLEKIHYLQLKIIKDRRARGLLDGIQIKPKGNSASEIKNELEKVLKSIMAASRPDDKEPETLAGMHFYRDMLYAMPLTRVEELEHRANKAIKCKKELYRQKIDAGKLDKIVRGC